MVRLSDDQYQQFLQQGIISPDAPKKRKSVKSVTLDSRFEDRELVQFYQTIERLERDFTWKLQTFLCRLALGTGARESEMAGLRFALDPADDARAECHRSGVITIRNGKGGKKRDARCIPEFYPHYRFHLQFIADLASSDGYASPDGLCSIFYRGAGCNYQDRRTPNRTTLWRWWSAVLDQCPPEVRRLRLHDARHTYGSWEMLRLDEAKIQGLMGHVKSATFREHYHGVVAEYVYESKQPDWYRAALGRFA